MTSPRYQTLRNLDFSNLWHPFTQHTVWTEFDDPLIVERGEGFELIDADGRRYLDGTSSLWCNAHGHGVPELIQAIDAQAKRVCHSTLLGASHTSVLELTDHLLELVPDALTRAFYGDSGSNAVEAALRMSLEWWQKRETPAARNKTKFASLLNGYHGDTIGSVGVGYVEEFHHYLSSIVTQAYRVAPPHFFRFYEGHSEESALEQSIHGLEQLFRDKSDELAAFVVEPLVQAAAGIWIHPELYLKRIEELCRKYDVHLIADEVATGFGKTGKLFAIERAEVVPDVLVIGKALSGGYLPISAALASEEIYQGFSAPVEEGKTFFYGQTYGGNPLACAVSLANLKLFSKNDVVGNVCRNSDAFSTLLAKHIEPLEHVAEVRQLGYMVGIELTASAERYRAYPVQELIGWRTAQRARELGLVIRPLGNLILLMPAVAMNTQHLEQLVQGTAAAIHDVTTDE